jgi:hypothetical protein
MQEKLLLERAVEHFDINSLSLKLCGFGDYLMAFSHLWVHSRALSHPFSKLMIHCYGHLNTP